MWILKLFKSKHKPEPNWEISAWGTTFLRDIMVTTKLVYAKDVNDAYRQAKILAKNKEDQIEWKCPNFSMYLNGEYPNSIGVRFSYKPIKSKKHVLVP